MAIHEQPDRVTYTIAYRYAIWVGDDAAQTYLETAHLRARTCLGEAFGGWAFRRRTAAKGEATHVLIVTAKLDDPDLEKLRWVQEELAAMFSDRPELPQLEIAFPTPTAGTDLMADVMPVAAATFNADAKAHGSDAEAAVTRARRRTPEWAGTK